MAIDSVASQPTSTTPTQTSAIKVATPEAIKLNNPSLPIDLMTQLVFQDIGGLELINIARNDIIAGQNVIYQPIKNIASLYLQYNPQNILRLQDTSENYFKNFSIKFESKLPNVGTGPNGEIVYVDPTNGNIIINVVNMEPHEQVEVQMMSSGDVLSGTIYGVN